MEGSRSILEVKRTLFENSNYDPIMNEFMQQWIVILHDRELSYLADDGDLGKAIFNNLIVKVFNARVHCIIKDYRQTYLSRVILKEAGLDLQLRQFLNYNRSRKTCSNALEKTTGL